MLNLANCFKLNMSAMQNIALKFLTIGCGSLRGFFLTNLVFANYCVPRGVVDFLTVKQHKKPLLDGDSSFFGKNLVVLAYLGD